MCNKWEKLKRTDYKNNSREQTVMFIFNELCMFLTGPSWMDGWIDECVFRWINKKRHKNVLPGGHILQLGRSLTDELTKVPIGQGKNLKSVDILANPDCCSAFRMTPIVLPSRSSSSIYSSPLFPTPLNFEEIVNCQRISITNEI